MSKTLNAAQHKLVTSFESVRRMLLDQRCADRLDKPLAYWALPNDRRLPLALLDRSLAELLSRPFDEISGTPGIGQKKMGAMIKLMLRAAKDETPEVPFGIIELVEEHEDSLPGAANGTLDAALVSESQWARWKETVVRHGVQNVKLGRIAASLAEMPTVIWNKPLGYYLPYTVQEMRQLKTYGEKRIGVVLEVFHLMHQMLHAVTPASHLRISVVPEFATALENWGLAALQAATLPDEEDVRQHLALPLLRQTRLDLGEEVHRLAEGRLGVRGKILPVKEQSRRMGVTRARIYQLLDHCGQALAVRWPEGRCLLGQLAAKYDEAQIPPQQRALLEATRELFFPSRYQQMDEELERE
jgi:hypothetical protein